MANATTEDKKTRTRERILDSASKLLRKKGILAASVSDVMSGAGLTVGGFYAHFGSKENLVAEAFRWTVDRATGRVLEGLHGSTSERVREFLRRYLSAEHRDHAEQGCPVAALAADFGDESVELRRVFAEAFEKLAAERMSALSDGRRPVRREEMIAMMATYIGAILLARATRGTELSDEILAVCRKSLGERFS